MGFKFLCGRIHKVLNQTTSHAFSMKQRPAKKGTVAVYRTPDIDKGERKSVIHYEERY